MIKTAKKLDTVWIVVFSDLNITCHKCYVSCDIKSNCILANVVRQKDGKYFPTPPEFLFHTRKEAIVFATEELKKERQRLLEKLNNIEGTLCKYVKVENRDFLPMHGPLIVAACMVKAKHNIGEGFSETEVKIINDLLFGKGEGFGDEEE